jgi:hypothetical protein
MILLNDYSVQWSLLSDGYVVREKFEFVPLIDYPGRSRPAVNGRTPMIYDEKRRLFTVIVYGSHIRRFTVYYAYHKQ